MSKVYVQAPGIIGVVLTICALLFKTPPEQPTYFVIGACLMMLTALLDRHRFYIALEIVVLTGCILGLLQASFLIALLTLVIVTIPVVVVSKRKGIISTQQDYMGMFGLVALAASYAVMSYPLMIASGALLSAYSWLDYRRGGRVAFLWLVLNVVFTFSALKAMIYKL